MGYLFFKWLHIVAIISWMAGILYLYRLLIYHAERGVQPDIHDLLTLMSKRLFWYITKPAMVVSYIAGFAMVYISPGLMKGGWFHTKLACVLLLTVSTFQALHYMKRFAAKDEAVPTSKQLRFYNEVPTILMLVIVGMVIFKPF